MYRRSALAAPRDVWHVCAVCRVLCFVRCVSVPLSDPVDTHREVFVFTSLVAPSVKKSNKKLAVPSKKNYARHQTHPSSANRRGRNCASWLSRHRDGSYQRRVIRVHGKYFDDDTFPNTPFSLCALRLDDICLCGRLLSGLSPQRRRGRVLRKTKNGIKEISHSLAMERHDTSSTTSCC